MRCELSQWLSAVSLVDATTHGVVNPRTVGGGVGVASAGGILELTFPLVTSTLTSFSYSPHAFICRDGHRTTVG